MNATKLSFLTVLLAVSFSFFTACDSAEGELDIAIDDATIDVPLNFTKEEPKLTDTALRDGDAPTLYTFAGEATVDFSDDMFDEIKGKSFNDLLLTVNDAKVKVVEIGESTGEITELKLICFVNGEEFTSYTATKSIVLNKEFVDAQFTKFLGYALAAFNTEAELKFQMTGKALINSESEVIEGYAYLSSGLTATLTID